MVGEMLEQLWGYPGDARVVVRDEPAPGKLLELHPQHVVLRSVKRRGPRVSGTTEGDLQMTVGELIEILERYPRTAWVVQADDQAPGEIIELRPQHVHACAVAYPHPDRGPKLLPHTTTKISVFIGPRTPRPWVRP